ncbi:MAG: protein-export chaperone SecB [Gammaproteobacteria bacterium]|nr:MAG: protein-export chaperone SecB [Gammaproteobacteria bacterium]
MAEDAAKTPQKQVTIQKIYVKDVSFESPHAPQVFTKSDWVPQTNLNLRSMHTALDNDHHEVVLTITVDTKHEDKTLFLVELHQAGIFHISGYDGEEMASLLGSFCPGILFPYARETIAGMVCKGGFPDFTLQPINFDALYAQSRQQAAEQPAAAGNGEGTGPH